MKDYPVPQKNIFLWRFTRPITNRFCLDIKDYFSPRIQRQLKNKESKLLTLDWISKTKQIWSQSCNTSNTWLLELSWVCMLAKHLISWKCVWCWKCWLIVDWTSKERFWMPYLKTKSLRIFVLLINRSHDFFIRTSRAGTIDGWRWIWLSMLSIIQPQ
jgi:hypothetical protein